MNDIIAQATEATEADAGFFSTTVLVYYRRDEALKERFVNVLLKTDLSPINRDTLDTLRHLAADRIVAEHKVAPEAIVDVVIFSINMLGVMTETEFQGSYGRAPAAPQEG